MKRKIYSQEQPKAECFRPLKEQQQQAIIIYGGSGYAHGVAAAEAWGNCESFDVRYFREVNEKVPGIDGQLMLRVMSTVASRDISMKGEVNAALSGFSMTAATAVANAVADIGSAAGTIIFEDATVALTRTGQRSIDAKLSSNPSFVLS